MNRIAKRIPNSKIKFSKNIRKFDYRMLMNLNCDFSIALDNPIVKSYDYWNSHQYLFNTDGIDGARQEDLYMYQKIRQNILQDSGKSLDYVVNTLIAYLYTVRPMSIKKMLWSSFGDVIVKNLQENTKSLGLICPVCGKRFNPLNDKQVYCSRSCYLESNRDMAKRRKLEKSL